MWNTSSIGRPVPKENRSAEAVQGLRYGRQLYDSAWLATY